jgi:hypothetical protein
MITRKLEHFIALGEYQRNSAATHKYTAGSPIKLLSDGTVEPFDTNNPELIVGFAMNEEADDYGPYANAEPYITFVEGPALVQIDVGEIDIFTTAPSVGQFLVPAEKTIGSDNYAGWTPVTFNAAGTNTDLAFGKVEMVDGDIITVKFFSGPMMITY